ncbi:unnamed protein product [Rhizophagus irregularis]|nr:unnamed protein product [Rhizophagus irregularis]
MESRIWIDLKSQEILEREIPDHLTRCAFNAICSIYLEFCNERIPFKANYLQYLTLVNNEEIIRPLFEISLPNLFGLELKCNSYKIDYEYNRPEIDNNENNKRKYTDMNEQPEHPDRSGWIRLLEDLQTLVNNNTDITETFRNNFEKFLERITSSQNQEINEEVCPKRLKQ